MKKKLNVAIVGAGGRGISCFGKHLASRRDCTISAICDINEVRGRLAAEKLNVPVFYADLKQMLKKEKPDAVIITTPDAAHLQLDSRFSDSAQGYGFCRYECLYPGRFPFYSGERKGAGTRMCGMPLCEEWTLQRRLSPAGRRMGKRSPEKRRIC